jgi:DNA polymerase III subunit delta'
MTAAPGLDESALTGVWAGVVGQEPLVATLTPAIEGARQWLGGHDNAAMTHAWLLTGPPGSGRSVAARAFAAALQCEQSGCGECDQCRQVLAGSHPDVTVVDTSGLSIGVDDVRDLVLKAAMSPTRGRWAVVIVEDADRLTDQAADAMLKSLEEPAPHTVWVLCAPTTDDVLVTVRSRCRHVSLRTPPAAAVSALLERQGIDAGLAAFAARASQGHIGRARALARDEAARTRRREVMELPARLTDPGACLRAAANVHEASTEDAESVAGPLEERELAAHRDEWGTGTRGIKVRGEQGALSELKKMHKARRTRLVRDAVDRALLDLLSFYRDVLAMQLGSGGTLVNEEHRPVITDLARRTDPALTLRRADAVLACRTVMDEHNVAPLLALEQAFLRLRTV